MVIGVTVNEVVDDKMEHYLSGYFKSPSNSLFLQTRETVFLLIQELNLRKHTWTDEQGNQCLKHDEDLTSVVDICLTLTSSVDICQVPNRINYQLQTLGYQYQ